ncbi:hypothetical protein BDK51DRAFT_22241, partial [Blyttiomyces helicus]
SCHKSQGLTLDHNEAHLQGAFCYGQVYVMLSRCSSMKGLIIRNFSEESILVDEKVWEFYEQH